MLKISSALLIISLFYQLSSAQIINGQDTLYGNEWINFDQSYFKIMVAEDGIYRLPYQVMADAGLPVGSVQGSQFQIFHNGEEIPIYTSTNGLPGSGDYIDFFGQKNTSELDRHLFKNPDDEMMNPLYSLFTDTSAYYLTWKLNGPTKRYQTVANDLTNLPGKEEYYNAELVQNFFSTLKKKQNSQGISSSDYGPTEGYATNFANTQTFTLSPDAVFTGGGNGQLSIRYSANIGSHKQEVSLNGQVLTVDDFFDYQVRKLNFDISNSTLTSPMQLKFLGTVSNNDNQRVSNLILRYPRVFDFENKSSYFFDIEASGTLKYLEITNFNSTNGVPVLYDLTNGIRIAGIVENNKVKIALPPSPNSRKLVLVNDNSGLYSVNAIQPVNFINYEDLNAEFIILSNPKLYNDGNGNNYVQQYADYRASTEGGGYQTVIVDVQQLYDQFGWGLNRHPLSIRNFTHYVKREWAGVKYFFVMGKGREYPGVRLNGQLASSANESFYVPTFGVPGSDNLLLAGSDGFTPVIPVGRIAASTTNDIRIYLDKVKEFEGNRDLPQTIEDRGWMKRVLHLGGGATNSEQSTIKSYLTNMKGVIESNQFGASVTSFFKTSTDPIQVSQTEQIFNRINSGVSLITFFGHSAVGAFDFSIDNPDNYENQGKYPMIVSLGCYSGNIHTSAIGLSERFNFFENKGSIAFGATAGQGYISSLYTFAKEFYDQIGLEVYGQGIGDALQKTIGHFSTNDFGVNLIRQQFNYHGDPALRLNPSPSADYTINAASVAFSPPNLTTQITSFDLSFDLVNLGKFLHDSIRVAITQELPDGSKVQMVNKLVSAPAFNEKLTFQMPTFGNAALGFNHFYIVVDDSNHVEELPLPAAENNNELVTNGVPGIGVYFTDNSAVAVYPPEFGIVSSPTVELKATTSNLLLPERMYVIEIDTSELFSSPLKLSTKITQPGGVIRWKPPVNWVNNTVYYWRISPDSLSEQERFVWDYSSFLYLENSGNGWNQSHYYQWKKDEFVNMELPVHGNLKFLDNFKDVYIKNAVNTVDLTLMYINNGYAGRYWYSPDAGIYVVVFDSTTVKNWVNSGPPYQYGLPQPNGYWVATYLFETVTQVGRKQLIDFLEGVIPDKNYVFLFTVQGNPASDYRPQDWESDQTALGTDLFQVLEKQGAAFIRNTLQTGSLPYVFAYKKGIAPITEGIAKSLTDILEVNFSIPGYWDRGEVKSTPIGPAKNWKTLQWESFSYSQPGADTISLDIFATDPVAQKDTLLMTGLKAGETDLSTFDATQFPYLKLRFNSKDSLYRTSAQLKYWRVLYDGIPDFAINPARHFSLQSDTLPQGKPLKLEYLVENLADAPGDSLNIRYSLRNQANEENIVLQKVKPLLGNDTLTAHLQFDTRMLYGMHSLSIELNPGSEQPELTRINNILQTGFFVDTDKRNPLIDVTFDGQHILDGDLVSAKPLIRIGLKDENQYLALDDTSVFRLFIAYPDTSESLHRIYFNDPILEFFPASAGSTNQGNKASVQLNPVFLQDGEYQLIVQAQDATGNPSGQFDFKTSFKVITKSMISNILNYPNPFTTSTRFVYTLTGSEPPERVKIQIMTISGRIIRELRQDELGIFKVGTHQTDYAWDGTDEYGDRLAKGVYLYRVLVQDENGKEWERYETGADGVFKNGYGKMVLLR